MTPADETLPADAQRFRRDLLDWAEDNLRTFPWRDPDASLYEVFVAEFFLTQTPAENVARVYPEFLDEYPDLGAIEAAGVEELSTTIEPLGFQNMRSEALAEIASRRDRLPTDPERLRSLPRVGPYVADATLCFACSQQRPIVDRNVVRTYQRVFGEDFPEESSARREFADAILPADGSRARTYNLALLDFGAIVCQSTDPRCESCFASSYCSYYRAE